MLDIKISILEKLEEKDRVVKDISKEITDLLNQRNIKDATVRFKQNGFPIMSVIKNGVITKSDEFLELKNKRLDRQEIQKLEDKRCKDCFSSAVMKRFSLLTEVYGVSFIPNNIFLVSISLNSFQKITFFEEPTNQLFPFVVNFKKRKSSFSDEFYIDKKSLINFKILYSYLRSGHQLDFDKNISIYDKLVCIREWVANVDPEFFMDKIISSIAINVNYDFVERYIYNSDSKPKLEIGETEGENKIRLGSILFPFSIAVQNNDAFLGEDQLISGSLCLNITKFKLVEKSSEECILSEELRNKIIEEKYPEMQIPA